MISVRARLTIAFALMMALVLAAAGLFVHQRLRANLDAGIATGLRARAADIAALAQQSDSGLHDAARSGPIDPRAQLAQIIDQRGRVVDETPGLGGRPLILRSRLPRSLAAGSVAATTARGDLPIRVLATPVRAQDQTVIVVVGQPLQERDRALSDVTQQLLLGGPAALLLASLAGYVLIGAALRPVEVMRRRERAFVADASHELRTPLTVLRAELELIGRDRPAGAELDSSLASAIDETERLSRLADDLLQLTRTDHGKPALDATRECADELLKDAARRAAQRVPDARIAISVRDGSEAALMVDRDRVVQALDNLLDNAVRHARTSVELRAVERDGVLDLHVRDDGPGFPGEFLPRAWDRFARADDARSEGGTGLGLAIVRTVAELHGGSANAANQPGGGADVWVTLPRAPRTG